MLTEQLKLDQWFRNKNAFRHISFLTHLVPVSPDVRIFSDGWKITFLPPTSSFRDEFLFCTDWGEVEKLKYA